MGWTVAILLFQHSKSNFFSAVCSLWKERRGSFLWSCYLPISSDWHIYIRYYLSEDTDDSEAQSQKQN